MEVFAFCVEVPIFHFCSVASHLQNTVQYSTAQLSGSERFSVAYVILALALLGLNDLNSRDFFVQQQLSRGVR